MVERLFREIDVGCTGLISSADVVAWVGAQFRLDNVLVPGQGLDRPELAAVRARIDTMTGECSDATGPVTATGE